MLTSLLGTWKARSEPRLAVVTDLGQGTVLTCRDTGECTRGSLSSQPTSAPPKWDEDTTLQKLSMALNTLRRKLQAKKLSFKQGRWSVAVEQGKVVRFQTRDASERPLDSLLRGRGGYVKRGDSAERLQASVRMDDGMPPSPPKTVSGEGGERQTRLKRKTPATEVVGTRGHFLDTWLRTAASPSAGPGVREQGFFRRWISEAKRVAGLASKSTYHYDYRHGTGDSDDEDLEKTPPYSMENDLFTVHFGRWLQEVRASACAYHRVIQINESFSVSYRKDNFTCGSTQHFRNVEHDEDVEDLPRQVAPCTFVVVVMGTATKLDKDPHGSNFTQGRDISLYLRDENEPGHAVTLFLFRDSTRAKWRMFCIDANGPAQPTSSRLLQGTRSVRNTTYAAAAKLVTGQDIEACEVPRSHETCFLHGLHLSNHDVGSGICSMEICWSLFAIHLYYTMMASVGQPAPAPRSGVDLIRALNLGSAVVSEFSDWILEQVRSNKRIEDLPRLLVRHAAAGPDFMLELRTSRATKKRASLRPT